MDKKTLLEFIKNNDYSINEEIETAAQQLIEILDAQKSNLEDIAIAIKWLEQKRKYCSVKTKEIGIKDLDNKWRVHPNTGNIHHESGKFFSIVGVKVSGAEEREVISWTQPIMKQNECGILGILCKKINGVMHYLLYAKYEPGSIINPQLSPALQATESNLKQTHGGKKPFLAEYFEDGRKGKIITSVIQVEDPGRFYLKTNRCMIVEIDENELINLPNDYIWLTLPQIKKLLKMDNVVNALARAVLGSR